MNTLTKQLVGTKLHRFYVLMGYDRPWQARIKRKGKEKSLGYYATEQEAHKAYLMAKDYLDTSSRSC